MTFTRRSTSDVSYNILSFLFFFTGLSIVYYNDISVNWAYMGFSRGFSLEKLAIALLVLASLSLFVSRKLSVKNFFVVFAIYAYIIPALVIFYLGEGEYTLFVVVFAGFLALWLAQKLRIPRVRFQSLSRKSVLGLCLGWTLFVILGMIAFGAYRSFNLDIFRVYEFRREAAVNLPSSFGYLLSPTSKIMIPIGLILGVFYRSRTTTVLFGVLTIVFFGLTHHKSVLFAPFFVLLVYYSLQKAQNLNFLVLLFASIAMIGLCEYLAIYFLSPTSETGLFSTLVIRRVLFVPPLLDQFYVDFFSTSDPYYWAGSRISFGLTTTEYHTTAPFVIGEEFFGNPDTSANTGFIGSGFSNAGFFGVILYGSILGIIISALNSYGKELGHPFVISASFTVIFGIFTSTDLVTSLLTHGLLLFFLLLSIMPTPRTTPGGKK